MAYNYPTYTGTTHYPISDLHELSRSTLSLDTMMELVVDDYGTGDTSENASWVNRRANIETFFDFLISSHPIFNKIDEIYNSELYPSDIYLNGITYFASNPYSQDKSDYSELFENQTVTKDQLEWFLNANSLQIHSTTNTDVCRQYIDDGFDNEIDNTNAPTYTSGTVIPFKKPVKLINVGPIQSIPFYHTSSITPALNAFLTIVGLVEIPYEYLNQASIPYYTPERNLWVGAVWNGNIISLTELHNIRIVKVNETKNRAIAYFSMQFPVIKDESYYIIIPFVPPEQQDPKPENDFLDDIPVGYDMFKDIRVNSIAAFYYAPCINNDKKKFLNFKKPETS